MFFRPTVLRRTIDDMAAHEDRKSFHHTLMDMVIPIAFQNFMTALVSASDAVIFVQGTDTLISEDKAVLGSYFSGNIRKISDQEFAALLGHNLPDGHWSGLLDRNDAICQMYYAKGMAACLVYRILTGMLNKSMEKGKTDLNIMFIYNMPFRGIGKMDLSDLLLFCFQYGSYYFPVYCIYFYAGNPWDWTCRYGIYVAAERNAYLGCGFYLKPFGI